jgi:hypothetical protein
LLLGTAVRRTALLPLACAGNPSHEAAFSLMDARVKPAHDERDVWMKFDRLFDICIGRSERGDVIRKFTVLIAAKRRIFLASRE